MVKYLAGNARVRHAIACRIGSGAAQRGVSHEQHSR
jgi:hypothetical protein